MARTSSTWQKGRSGNPSGRPRSLASRRVLREALGAPADPANPEGGSLLEKWAGEIIAAATTLEDRLSVLKFLEGSAPPAKGQVAVEMSVMMTHEDALDELDAMEAAGSLSALEQLDRLEDDDDDDRE
jgi:hypothetical protein